MSYHLNCKQFNTLPQFCKTRSASPETAMPIRFDELYNNRPKMLLFLPPIIAVRACAYPENDLSITWNSQGTQTTARDYAVDRKFEPNCLSPRGHYCGERRGEKIFNEMYQYRNQNHFTVRTQGCGGCCFLFLIVRDMFEVRPV